MSDSEIKQDEDQETMVLRTVYLPSGLDEALKKLAFHGSTSKGALIRQALRKLVDGEAARVAKEQKPVKESLAKAAKEG
jgi:predicted transcriptional regulator